MSGTKDPQKIKKSERRMAENEVVFRNLNEQVEKDFDKLKSIAESEGWNEDEYPVLDDTPLHFYCECFDENCEKRIILDPKKYAEIHEHRERFIVTIGHNAEEIEEVIFKGNDYWIVQKIFAVDQNQSELKTTPKSVE